jgi:hypothetical protein
MALIAVPYITWSTYLIHKYYNNIKRQSPIGGIVNIVEMDSCLGFKLIPSSKDRYLNPSGGYLADIFVDDRGFRNNSLIRNDTLIDSFLFLGCSFTFGMNCQYEETYPYLLSKYYNANCYNSAMEGYGFAQMILVAEKYVPLIKPKIVFLQYSDWLLDRANSPFMETNAFLIYTPYFNYQDGIAQLKSPKRLNYVLNRNSLKGFISTSRGFSDFSNYWKVAFPNIASNHFDQISFSFEKRLNQDEQDRNINTIKYILERIQKLCSENGCEVVLIGIKDQRYKHQFHKMTYVDTEEALLQNLKGGNYSKAYHFWLPDSSSCYDQHPNKNAHFEMHTAIIKALE